MTINFDMNFITKPLYNHARLLMLLSFALAILVAGILLRTTNRSVIREEIRNDTEYELEINATTLEPAKTRRKEYLYRLLTNTTRSLIQMEIKARRLEENMRRIKEKTADLLWKNKDKALWHILFKNISRHISIRHEFHQHASLHRIMQDKHIHHGKGPGYASPLEAFTKGAREQLLYVVCVQPDRTKQDYLATVDVDPASPTYCKVIHRTFTGNVEDELHHSGWNVCSSCHDNANLKRDLLILPALGSCNVYAVDVGADPRKPDIHKVINGAEMRSFNCSFPHTTHCLATGEIMISTMGDKDENGKGDFVLIDSKTLKMTGTWTKGKPAKFGYDFWYQPYHDVMIATEWGTPKYFKTGFHPDDVTNADRYGRSLNVYKWSTRELQQVIDLGKEGIAPLEIRFLHDPKAAQGFVGCAVEANIYRFYKTASGTWKADKVIDIPAKKVSKDGVESQLNGLMSDILISLDDKYLYVSCWLHGDVRQYDISNPEKPKLVGIVRFGGLVLHDNLKVIEDKEFKEPAKPVIVKGKQLQGAPQMLQLSLDGKRLYVSSSLFSPWDKETYPKMVKEGGWIVKLDVDTVNGGLKLDPDFLVHFGSDEPYGPVLPHEMRYPGGDCTSDIWLAQDA